MQSKRLGSVSRLARNRAVGKKKKKTQFSGVWCRGHAEAMVRCKVASFNIRMKTNEPDPNDNWDCRKDGVLQALLESQASIIGLQEFSGQLEKFEHKN